MRRQDDVVELEQRARVRLLREDVERCGRDLPGLQRIDERGLVDQLAARRVDDAHTVAHPRERLRVDRAARLRGQRLVQGEEIGRREHIFDRFGPLRADVAEPLRVDERVVRDDAHPQPDRAAPDLLPDPAEAEHAERLVRELDAAPAAALPASLPQRGVRLRDVAREGDEQADRVLGCGDDRRLGRVRHDDPATRGGRNVDVVDADTGAADHLQPPGALDQLGGELGRRADDDPLVVADHVFELRVAVHVDVELLLQQPDARLRDLLPDQDPHVPGRLRLPPRGAGLRRRLTTLPPPTETAPRTAVPERTVRAPRGDGRRRQRRPRNVRNLTPSRARTPRAHGSRRRRALRRRRARRA